MPFGIFTETSGGLRDVISSISRRWETARNRTGSAGAVDFLQERDFFVDMRGRLFNRLEYVAGVMNNNNYHANATGAKCAQEFCQPCPFVRQRCLVCQLHTTIVGESNNANTNINGRGKGS
ncbi:MAG: hypothetical protein U0231_16230 [Nitrospiraceae bacterium]